jgi:protein Tex
VLEGTVSNVAAFGAFIDFGVHQDGLVHVSQLSHKFVTDAREVVKTGDIVKVQVVEVDVARKRIALTMKLGAPPVRRDEAGDNRFQPAHSQRHNGSGSGQGTRAGQGAPATVSTSMASAFAKLKR